MRKAMELQAIDVDLEANTLRLMFTDDAEGDLVTSEPATIDIGTGGRLIGLELEGGYVEVMEPEAGTDHLSRSADLEVGVERERGSDTLLSVTVPRRGTGYEITWPSGNQ